MYSQDYTTQHANIQTTASFIYSDKEFIPQKNLFISTLDENRRKYSFLKIYYRSILLGLISMQFNRNFWYVLLSGRDHIFFNYISPIFNQCQGYNKCSVSITGGEKSVSIVIQTVINSKEKNSKRKKESIFIISFLLTA